MFRVSVLLCALVFSGPTFWLAFTDRVSVDAALTRFLLAVPVAAVLLAVVRAATKPAPRRVEAEQPSRRR